MMRIDAHQHFWLLADRNGAWPPPELAAIHRDFLPPQLAPLLAQHGIDATVLVQSLPSVEDTIFMLDLAARHPFIKAVVGWVDMKAEDAPARIARLAMHPALKGLRPMLQDLPDDDWIADPALGPAVEAMRRHSLSLDALVLPRHLPSLLEGRYRAPGGAAAGVLQAVRHGDRGFPAVEDSRPAALCGPRAGGLRRATGDLGQRLAGTRSCG
jgi:L-fuconolactonase